MYTLHRPPAAPYSSAYIDPIANSLYKDHLLGDTLLIMVSRFDEHTRAMIPVGFNQNMIRDPHISCMLLNIDMII